MLEDREEKLLLFVREIRFDQIVFLGELGGLSSPPCRLKAFAIPQTVTTRSVNSSTSSTFLPRREPVFPCAHRVSWPPRCQRVQSSAPPESLRSSRPACR